MPIAGGRWTRDLRAATVALLASTWLACASPPAPVGTEDLPAGFVRLSTRTPALPRHAIDRGRLDGTTRIASLSLAFKLSPAQLADRDALLAALVDPASPQYRRFLTTRAYAARFGAPRETIDRVRGWLASQGLEVHEDSPLGARVVFSGTAERIEAALHTELHRYDVDGELHYAARLPPALPADLADAVAEISNLHDFQARPARAAKPDYVSGTGTTGFAPPDWANVYDSARATTVGIGGTRIDGTGVSIAVVGKAAIAASDLDAWRTQWGLPAGTVNMTLVPNTGSAAAGSGGSGFEGVLDVEWAGGIAPGATVEYVFTGDADGNVDDAAYYAIEQNLAPILSQSYSRCEESLVAAGRSGADQHLLGIYGSAANLLGITWVSSAGDEGAGCPSDGPGLWTRVPASFPGVTAVGGTAFPIGALTGSFSAYSTTETAWNEVNDPRTGVRAGGVGVSVLFSRPSYQAGVPTCAPAPTGASLPVAGIDPAQQRQVPDVAFTAGEGLSMIPLFVECTVDSATSDCSSTGGNPKLVAAGGTSFAAPAFAGVVALMDQLAGGRLGNINPLLYDMAQTTPSAFHDVATGNDEILCTAGGDPGCASSGSYGYAASAGYDCATGLGSLDVYLALNALAGHAATRINLVLNPTATSEGSPVGLTATVTVPQPNTGSLGGVVTFAFQSYDLDGNPDLSWTLGTGTISGGTTSSGTATLSAAVPPGLVRAGMQFVDVVAMYGGDAKHLPSTSSKVRLSFNPLGFVLQPASPTVAAGGTIQFSSTGGVGAVQWFTRSDTTCGATCSRIVESTGVFTAGSVAGTTTVFALDGDGAEATTVVTVTPPPDASVPVDASVVPDATVAPDATPAVDSSAQDAAAALADARVADGSTRPAPDLATTTTGDGNSGGCGCHVGGTRPAPAPLLLALATLALGFRRRRRRAIPR